MSALWSTRQDAQINYLSTLSIFRKQTTYLATLPNPKSEANECLYDGAVRDMNGGDQGKAYLIASKCLIGMLAPYPQGRSILVARLEQVERYEIWLVITALPVMEWVVAQSSGSQEH
jgi:hypothetical protein